MCKGLFRLKSVLGIHCGGVERLVEAVNVIVGGEDFESVARDRLQGVLSQIIGSDEVRQLSDRMAVDHDWKT